MFTLRSISRSISPVIRTLAGQQPVPSSLRDNPPETDRKSLNKATNGIAFTKPLTDFLTLGILAHKVTLASSSNNSGELAASTSIVHRLPSRCSSFFPERQTCKAKSAANIFPQRDRIFLGPRSLPSSAGQAARKAEIHEAPSHDKIHFVKNQVT